VNRSTAIGTEPSAAPVACPTGRELTSRHPACRAGIGAATAVGAAAVASIHRADPAVSVLLSMAVLCYGVLSAIDVAEQRLPNRITVPLAAATSVTVMIGSIARSDLEAGLGALGIGLAFSLTLLLMRFGMGDVKLALTVGTIAGWLGRDAVMTSALVGASSGAAAALALIAIHRRRDLSFSFGPFLAIGSTAGMLVAGS
jgi:leader peptidase (prepilin peptidase)/N-methyltransferase